MLPMGPKTDISASHQLRPLATLSGHSESNITRTYYRFQRPHICTGCIFLCKQFSLPSVRGKGVLRHVSKSSTPKEMRDKSEH
jgi:hypothetical protein